MKAYNHILSAVGLALFVGAPVAEAQSDCYVRYDRAYEAANQAFQNMPWKNHVAGSFQSSPSSDDERHAVLAVEDAIDTVQNWLRNRPAEIEPLVCGETLRKTEALVMVWREKGWLPTPAEKEAASRAAAVKALNDAVQVLATENPR